VRLYLLECPLGQVLGRRNEGDLQCPVVVTQTSQGGDSLLVIHEDDECMVDQIVDMLIEYP